MAQRKSAFFTSVETKESTKPAEIKLNCVRFPYFPDAINLADVDADLRLIPKTDIDKVINRIKEIKEAEKSWSVDEKSQVGSARKFKRDEIGKDFKYSIIEVVGERENQYFVSYKNLTPEVNDEKKGQDKIRRSRRVKYAQNLITGEIVFEKIQTISLNSHIQNEIIKLDEFKQLIVAFERDDKYSEKQSVILMQAQEGRDLHDIYVDQFAIINNGRDQLPLVRLLDIVIKFLQAVESFHSKKNKLHRDIKLDNVVYGVLSGKLSLVDFAYSAGMTEKELETKGFLGTHEYSAPEIDHQSYCATAYQYPHAAEIYSAGASIARFLQFSQTINKINTKFKLRSWSNLFPEIDDKELNAEIRKYENDIYQCLSKMMCHRGDEQPHFKIAIDTFKNIRNSFLHHPSANVAILDVKAYQEASAKTKESMLDALRCADKVWFIDNGIPPVGDRYYLEHFCKKGIIVGNRIFREPGRTVEDVLKDIPGFIRQRLDRLNSERHHNYFFVTDVQRDKEFVAAVRPQKMYVIHVSPEKQYADFKREYILLQPATAKVIENVKEKLIFNRNRLIDEKRNISNTLLVNPQIAMLDAALTAMSKKDLTYQDIKDEMQKVKRAMLPTGKKGRLRNFLAEKTGFKRLRFHPTTEAKIDSIEKEEVNPYKIRQSIYISRRLKS